MTGIVVVELASEGQAARVGIRMHDLLYKYNDEILNSTEELISATRTDKAKNEIIVIRGKQLLNFDVSPGSLGVSVLPYPIQDVQLDGVGEVLARIRYAEENPEEIQDRAKREELRLRLANLQTTTTPQLEGYRVVKHLGIVTSEYVSGVNLVADFVNAITDITGGRSGWLQKELRKMSETCINNLKVEADLLGANAVVGVHLNHSEISGGGKSMLFLVASGTAVIVEQS